MINKAHRCLILAIMIVCVLVRTNLDAKATSVKQQNLGQVNAPKNPIGEIAVISSEFDFNEVQIVDVATGKSEGVFQPKGSFDLKWASDRNKLQLFNKSQNDKSFELLLHSNEGTVKVQNVSTIPSEQLKLRNDIVDDQGNHFYISAFRTDDRSFHLTQQSKVGKVEIIAKISEKQLDPYFAGSCNVKLSAKYQSQFLLHLNCFTWDGTSNNAMLIDTNGKTQPQLLSRLYTSSIKDKKCENPRIEIESARWLSTGALTFLEYVLCGDRTNTRHATDEDNIIIIDNGIKKILVASKLAKKVSYGFGEQPQFAPFDWSPDGDWLAYTQADGIWAISTSGGNPVQLWKSQFPLGDIAWRPASATTSTSISNGVKVAAPSLYDGLKMLERISSETELSVSEKCTNKLKIITSQMPKEWSLAVKAAATTWTNAGSKMSVTSANDVRGTRKFIVPTGTDAQGKITSGHPLAECEILVVTASEDKLVLKNNMESANQPGWAIALADPDHPESILSSLIVLNDVNFNFATDDVIPKLRLDIETIALHEIGHAIGLPHNGSLISVMFGGENAHLLQFIGIKRRQLTSIDKQSIIVLYGESASKRSYAPIKDEDASDRAIRIFRRLLPW